MIRSVLSLKKTVVLKAIINTHQEYYIKRENGTLRIRKVKFRLCSGDWLSVTGGHVGVCFYIESLDHKAFKPGI